MIQEARLKQLQELINTSTQDELIWMNGYLNGVVSKSARDNNTLESKPIDVKKISLLFGTETGNAKSLATQFAVTAKKQGIVTKLSALDQYRLSDLPKEENLFIIVSTHGEGEPPEAAKKFYDYVHQSSLSLNQTKFSILGLGDTAYPLFCKTGQDIDAKLHQHGATRVVPLQKCDVDFEEAANLWFEQVLSFVKDAKKENSTKGIPIEINQTSKKSEKYFYDGTVVNNINLHDVQSTKETYHIEISTDEKIDYQAGDSLALIPENKASVVDKIIEITGSNAHTEIATNKFNGTLKDGLINHLNISYLLGSTIKKYSTIVAQVIPDTRMDLIDLLRIYPVKNENEFLEIVQILTPIAPRLYNISTSPKVHENELHITVRRDEFNENETKKFGLCSSLLGGLTPQMAIRFYIHKNKHFKLPDQGKDVIMIGPGTGIAPFRAFLSERDATNASGKNWLFFGEHHFQKDFLYQTEIQNYLKTAVLHKISLAFSRDQQEKIYVQHKILEQGKEFFSWVDGGASIYLSGTKAPMSVDVEASILQVFEQFGEMSGENAKEYLGQLKKEGRYQKEVY
jgi:sulfite reductase (NADPH) flavoprotein alpha-component